MAEGDHLAQPTSAKRLKPPHHTHRISAHVAQRALRLPTGGRFMRRHGWPLAPEGHLLHAPVRILVAVDPAAPCGRGHQPQTGASVDREVLAWLEQSGCPGVEVHAPILAAVDAPALPRTSM